MRSSYVFLVAVFVLAVSALSNGCQQQGEGDVCDPRAGNNGNADCQNGLVCTQPSQLAAGTQGYRCCPGDPALATGVCALGQSSVPEDSAAPSSGSTPDAADANASDADSGEGGESGPAAAASTGADGSSTTGDAATE